MVLAASDVYYSLLEIFILLAFAELVHSVTRRLGMPQIVSEVLAGMVFGGFALGGLVNRFLGVPLFVVNDYVLIFADFSVILVIFAAGLQGGLATLRHAGWWAVGAAVAGDLIPFLATFAVFSFFEPFTTALLLGVAAGATSTAVVASLIQSEGIASQTSGRFLLTVSAIDDVVGLLLLSVVLTIAGGSFNILAVSGGIAISVIAWVILLVAAVFLIPRLFRVPAIRTSQEAPFVILFMLVAIVGALGFSVLVGAFIAGLAIAESFAASRARQTVELLLTLFGALFFVVIGAQFDIAYLLVPQVLVYAALLFGIAAAGKFIGVFPFALGRFRSAGRAAAIATGVIPRGEIGLVVGAVGLSLGAFGQPLLGAIVLMSLLTTVFGAALVREFRTALADPPVGEAMPLAPEG